MLPPSVSHSSARDGSTVRPSGKLRPRRTSSGSRRFALAVEGDLAQRAGAGDVHVLLVQAEVGVVQRALRVERHPGRIAPVAGGQDLADEGAVGGVLADAGRIAAQADHLRDEEVAVRRAGHAQRGDGVAVGDEGRLGRRDGGALAGVGGERPRVALHLPRRPRLGHVDVAGVVAGHQSGRVQIAVERAAGRVVGWEEHHQVAVAAALRADGGAEQAAVGVDHAADRIGIGALVGEGREGDLLQEGAVGGEDAPARAHRRLAGVLAGDVAAGAAGQQADLAVDVGVGRRNGGGDRARGEVVLVELVVLRAEQHLAGGAAAAAGERLADAADQLVDGDRAVAVVVDRIARGHRVGTEGDVDGTDQLVDGHLAVVVAVADAGGAHLRQQKRRRERAHGSPAAERRTHTAPVASEWSGGRTLPCRGDSCQRRPVAAAVSW